MNALEKYLRLSTCCLATFSFIREAECQGTFQNLGFESANVSSYPPDPPSFIPFTDALPGWTGYVGTNQLAQAMYNGISIGGALVSILDHQSANYSSRVIAGSYTATLDAGIIFPDGIHGTNVPAAIAQTSLIPVNAQSLRFSASGDVIGFLTATFNGQSIPFITLGAPSSNFQAYGADISPFAGITGELRFIEQAASPQNFPIAFLDSIQFSSQPIPEPSSFAVFALAALFFRRRFARQR